MDTKAAMTTDEICKLRERCTLLEERLQLLERAVLCVLDSGEKVQVFRQCLQQPCRPAVAAPAPPSAWSEVASVTSVATAARAAEPCQG